jgi:hypothetical protein
VFARYWLSGTHCNPKVAIFPPYFADFFDQRYGLKKSLRLAKNGHFWVSEAITYPYNFRYHEQNIINFKDTTKHPIAALKKLFC